MKAHNERPKAKNEELNGQNESTWRPKKPKWKEMKDWKDWKAKMKGNEGPKRQTWKQMKPQKAKMKGNEGPKGQNRVSLGVAYLDPISKMAHKMFKIT